MVDGDEPDGSGELAGSEDDATSGDTSEPDGTQVGLSEVSDAQAGLKPSATAAALRS